MAHEPRGLTTQLVHAGEPIPRVAGAVAMPVFQSSTFEFGGPGASSEVRYIRLSNTPNHAALAAKLAVVEASEAALVAASGMAAVSAAMLAVLKAGDHILVQDPLYGGTHAFVHHDLPDLGIEHDVVRGDLPETWKAKLRPTTRMVWVETIANPLLQVPELDAVVTFAREHGLVAAIDNTFASPVNYRPCAAGFDLAIESATKYLNGHTDIVAGVIAGRADLVERAALKLKHLGGSLDPHACFLLQRGLKTLALRIARHNANALTLAEFLERRDGVGRVHYPGLPSSPEHARAKRYLQGFGGMVSFELEGGAEAADAMFARLVLPAVAPSLGGVETLVTRPSTTSHAGLSPTERAGAGITDGLVRVSVGIEDAEDLVEDFDRAIRI